VDVARGEATEKELDQLIARRSNQKDPYEEDGPVAGERQAPHGPQGGREPGRMVASTTGTPRPATGPSWNP